MAQWLFQHQADGQGIDHLDLVDGSKLRPAERAGQGHVPLDAGALGPLHEPLAHATGNDINLMDFTVDYIIVKKWTGRSPKMKTPFCPGSPNKWPFK